MKRLVIILFSAFYLFAVSGVPVHYHYCGGKLTALDFGSPRKNPCPCGEKEMPGCCTHKVLVSKTSDAFKPGVAVLGNLVFSDIIGVIAPAINSYFISSKPAKLAPKFYLSSWRSRSQIPLFLLYSVFRN